MTELRAHRERLEEVVATRTRELREAKDEAERASEAKSRFLAHMSHEIRSPLHVMMLNAVILESARSLSAEERKCVGTIEKSGEHLAAIINNVLEMSTIEAGRLTLVEDPFDVGETLDEVAQMFAVAGASNGMELRVEPAPGLPGRSRRWQQGEADRHQPREQRHQVHPKGIDPSRRRPRPWSLTWQPWSRSSSRTRG